MKIKPKQSISLILAFASLVISTAAHSKSIYSPWHPKIASMTAATPQVYTYISGEVEINPAGCSNANGYVLLKKSENFRLQFGQH